MNQQQTIVKIAQLCQSLPAITVDSYTAIGAEGAYFKLRILDLLSLARIKWCCNAANLKNELQLDNFPRKKFEEVVANDLLLHISIPDKKRERDFPTSLQVLGIRLVWALKPLGLISATEERRLLIAWKGAAK